MEKMLSQRVNDGEYVELKQYSGMNIKTWTEAPSVIDKNNLCAKQQVPKASW